MDANSKIKNEMCDDLYAMFCILKIFPRNSEFYNIRGNIFGSLKQLSRIHTIHKFTSNLFRPREEEIIFKTKLIKFCNKTR